MDTRRTIDRLRVVYLVLVMSQFVMVVLYELGRLPQEVAFTAGLATSVVGPFLSFFVSLHVFWHRRASKLLDLASVAMTYLVTCLSFAIIYVLIADHVPRAFNLPPSDKALDFSAALYFSLVTITTTGYGDIAPAASLARLAACWEIVTGLLYQVFVFSLVASIIAPESGALPRAPPEDGRPLDT